MNFPAAMPGFAGGTLQPAFGATVDVACQEIPASTAIAIGIGLGQRRHRAAGAGLGIFPGLAGILVPLGQDVGGGVRAKVRSLSVGTGAGPEIEPVTTSLSSALEKKPPSEREKLQPPELAPIRNKVTIVPAGRIANSPMRPHALYRRDCTAH